ncbi:thioredoxin H-type 1 [Prunus dulcis]|uniref:Thioredoxin H-type 1 n=2 Tax=Prunus dulcis TaxID=3755 RepID=A0A4Y1QSU0_PRUDU|nr:thioredoxin H-type 1 [Prunus dulcis]BBN69035.1 thioredoxin H-type 1 [Prunus dulcis]
MESKEKMAEENQVIDCHTTEAWEEKLHKGNENKKLLVVDFTAWSYGPCQLIAPILAELAKKNPKVTFLKVDVDELKTVSEKWGVDAVPTFLFLKEGKVVDKVVGAKKDELRTKVEKHDAAASRVDDTSHTGATAKATATACNSATATATATATSTAAAATPTATA